MLNRRNIFFLATIALILLTNIMAQTSPTNFPKPPATAKQPVTNDYFGHKVVDNYQWLEDATSPATGQWVAQQLAYTRGILDSCPDASNCMRASPNCSRSATWVALKSAATTTSTLVARARRTSRCFMFERASMAKTKFWSM